MIKRRSLTILELLYRTEVIVSYKTVTHISTINQITFYLPGGVTFFQNGFRFALLSFTARRYCLFEGVNLTCVRIVSYLQRN